MPHALLAGFAALALSLPAAADVIRLPDGRLVHGTIVAFDEGTGITVERVDTGGVVTLRWEHLPDEEVARIKADRGFTGDDVEPYLVPVVHLVMKNGSTETGMLVQDGRSDVYTLERRGAVETVPRQYVRRVEPGTAEGLEVYGPDALYEVLLADLGTPTDVAGHFRVAVAAEGAALFERAKEHYQAVAELDEGFKTDLVAMRIERMDVKIEDAAETAVLSEIRNRLYRKKHASALEMVRAFQEEYPTSRQLGDAVELEQEILRERRAFYGAKMVADYFSFLGKVIGEIARNDDLGIEGAVELVEADVHGELIARLSRSYGMSEEELAEMWLERRPGSVRTRNYGTGTFILGEERALDFEVGEDAPDELVAEVVVEEDLDLAARLEQLRKEQLAEREARKSSSRSRALQDVGPTPDEWWTQTPRAEREDWLVAYYAEHSGHLLVVRARPRECRISEGTGVIQVLNEKGEYEFVTCPTCKGLKYERLLSFR